MKYDVAGLETLVDANYYENIAQEIDGAEAAEVCIAFLDSFAVKLAPVKYHPLNIMQEDLDVDLQLNITHTLGSLNLKIVLYDPNGYRVWNTHFDFRPINTTTARITFYAGITYKRSYKGYIYLIA
jgi:hypothetical protein